MLLERFAFIFEVMVYIGFGLPLINLLFSAFSSFGSSGADAGVDTDIDFDAGTDLDVGAEVDFGGDIDVDVDLDIDAGDLDLDMDASAENGTQGAVRTRSFLGFNLYCLCLALVTMGATGLFALNRFGVPMVYIALTGCLVLACATYTLLYRLVVRRLQQNDPKALNKNDLLYQYAIVTFRIKQDSPGQIQAKDATGAYISYQAVLDQDVCKVERIDEGQEVLITEIDKEHNLCSVTLAKTKLK